MPSSPKSSGPLKDANNDLTITIDVKFRSRKKAERYDLENIAKREAKSDERLKQFLATGVFPPEDSPSDDDNSDRPEDEDMTDYDDPMLSLLLGLGDGDELDEFEWLEAIDCFLKSKDHPSDEDNAGYCGAKLIHRRDISPDFLGDLEEPCKEMADLAEELFDRYGTLKHKFIEHEIKKGSGAWGKELDSADLLMIEFICINSAHRRKQLGTQMIKAVFDKAATHSKSFIALVAPGYLNREVDKLTENLTEDQIQAVRDQQHDIADVFFRSLGFRRIGSSSWMGLSSNPSHPAREIGVADDFELPPRRTQNLLPDSEALCRLFRSDDDGATLKKLEATFGSISPDDPRWLATTESGNTILHLAAENLLPLCLDWILKHNPKLAQLKNDAGSTVLDSAEDRTESLRVWLPVMMKMEHVSDYFKGFGVDAVRSLAILKGLKNPSADELERLKYGCSCGQCLEGFLSPRMQFALLCQAECYHDMMNDSVDDAQIFVESYGDAVLTYLPPRVTRNLLTNKSMRQGAASSCQWFAMCLKHPDKYGVPSPAHMSDACADGSEWPPVTKSFVERGGSFHAIGSGLFELAMDQDEYSGDGEHLATFEEKITKLPACRNDHEFGFASSLCGYVRVSGKKFVNARTGQVDEGPVDFSPGLGAVWFPPSPRLLVPYS